MKLSLKSTLKDAAALALVGVVALAPLTAEARGTSGHFPEAAQTLTSQGNTQFSYEERVPTVKTTKRARANRPGLQLRGFGQGQFFGRNPGEHVPLSEIVRQRRDSVDYFNR